MDNKKVDLGSVLAGILWTVSGLLMLSGVLAGLLAEHGPAMVALAGPSLLLGTGAATVTIRGYLSERERLMYDAFIYGRETAARAVSPLHR